MHSKTKIIGLSLVTCLGLATSATAGLIGPVVDQALPAHSGGYGGWNLDNVTVKMTNLDYENSGKNFDTSTGAYDTMEEGDSFESDIKDNVTGEVLVHLHGKDWPVGEPAGIKVMNDPDANATLKHSKPASCIMTTSYYDENTSVTTEGDLSRTNPTQTLCDSPFQSHKRFKLNMLPSMVAGKATGDYAEGVNLTFNVEVEAGTRRYQILQKANNYTGVRLDGYKVEVGFGVGINFQKVSDANSSLVSELKLSLGIGEDTKDGLPADIWDAEAMATFSHGLFGPADYPVTEDSHFPENGFFDSRPAGYLVSMLDDNNDTIKSTGAMDSNYISAPPGVTGQFGDWLPSVWEPIGIFYDDDNDPETDAELQAFWGDDGAGHYIWMQGNEAGFAPGADI